MAGKLVSIEALQKRYRAFAAKDGNNFTKRGIYNWRKNRDFPEPVFKTPRLVFVAEEVLEWEKKQGWDGYFDELQTC
ncbi:hypothetical protein ACNO5E_11880 [Vibrio parahaemolyticus]